MRVLRVTNVLDQGHRPRRVIDQLVGSGTSPGAQMFAAHEAISTADFLKSLGIAAKELNETRYWLILVERMAWCQPEKLADLQDETLQLLSIIKAMIVRTKAKSKK